MNEQISDYKKRVDTTMRVRVEWQRELIFTATTPRGYDLEFDPETNWGCMPLEGLLMSLAGCMAIDVVAILDKMRTPPSRYRMEVTAERSPNPPQRLLAVDLIIFLSGDNLEPKKIERAIALSEEKYCSVRHSLREEIEIRTTYVLE